jgi:hypothetical protein
MATIMSRDNIPFFLHEAVLTLYPAAADGSSLTGQAIWSGALANQLKLRSSLEPLRLMGSGERYATEHHIDEEHAIEIERTWILRKQFLRDFLPGRNQQYVLELVWTADGVWYKRTYLGVTGRSVGLESRGTNQFLSAQVFRAQRIAEADGIASGGSIYTPTPQPGQAVAFFREDPFVNGEYLLGHYRWPQNVTLTSAELIGSAGQGSATVLTLEVGGVLTAKTLTIAAGTANQEVSVTVDLGGYVVTAGQGVRWVITAGPIPENAMWMAALTMVTS